MPERNFYVAQALLPTLGELCSPGKLKYAPPMRRSRLEMAKLQTSALLPTPASDAMLQPRTGVETSLDTAGTSACATWESVRNGS